MAFYIIAVVALFLAGFFLLVVFGAKSYSNAAAMTRSSSISPIKNALLCFTSEYILSTYRIHHADQREHHAQQCHTHRNHQYTGQQRIHDPDDAVHQAGTVLFQ